MREKLLRTPVLVAGLCVLLAACDQTSEITRDPVAAGVKASVDQERLTGNTARIAVRSFAMQDGTRKEVVGAQCRVESDELVANVVTPQKLVVPLFKQKAKFKNRGLPSALIFDCEQGSLSGRAQLVSNTKQVTTAPAGGLVGGIVSAALASSTPWNYPPRVDVTLQ